MSIRGKLTLILSALTVTATLIVGAAELLVSVEVITSNRIESIRNIAFSNGKALSEFIMSDYGGEKGAISADFVRSFITHIELGKTGLAFILDEENNVIFHAEERLVGVRLYTPVTVKDYKEGRLENVCGTADYIYDGNRRVMGYYIIEDINWMFVVRQDYSEITSSAKGIYPVSFAVLAIVLVLALAVGALISSIFTKPIYQLNDAFLKATTSANYVKCDIDRDDEFGQLAINYNIMISALDMSFTELQNALAEIKHLAAHDPMTGLINRTGFKDIITKRIEKGIVGGVFFFDLDNFKQVNDEYGHDYGDTMLIELSSRILLFDWVGAARIGGDEFVMLMEGNRHDVERRAEALLKTVSAPMMINGVEFVISGSLGVVTLDGSPADSDDVMKRADEAMYKAKTMGKNTYSMV